MSAQLFNSQVDQEGAFYENKKRGMGQDECEMCVCDANFMRYNGYKEGIRRSVMKNRKHVVAGDTKLSTNGDNSRAGRKFLENFSTGV